MSVIVAIKENNKIYIGCDSQVTCGGTRTTLKNPNNYKIWKVLGAEHCVMGHVGLVRESIPVRLMDSLVTDYAEIKGYVDYEYVCKRVYPMIIDELKSWNYIKSDGVFDGTESNFLFAYKNQLFNLAPDGCIIEIEDCVAIGSGSSQAIGSLLTSEGQDPRTRIIKAIKASAASDIYVDYPIIITDTENTEFEIITELDEKEGR